MTHRLSYLREFRNIGISHSVTLSGISTSVFINMKTNDEKSAYTLSDMEIYKNITPEFISSREDIINNASICYIDSEIPESSLSYIFNNIKTPIICQPVTISRTLKLKPHLKKIHTLIIGEKYIPLLFSEDLQEASNAIMCDKLLETGIKNIVCLGKKGEILINSEDRGLENFKTDFQFEINDNHGVLAAVAVIYKKMLNPTAPDGINDIIKKLL